MQPTGDYPRRYRVRVDEPDRLRDGREILTPARQGLESGQKSVEKQPIDDGIRA
jgi:hypothetical protein